MKAGEIRRDATTDDCYLVVLSDTRGFKRIWMGPDPTISVYSPAEGDQVVCDLSDAFGTLENLLKGRKT